MSIGAQYAPFSLSHRLATRAHVKTGLTGFLINRLIRQLD